MNSTRPSNLAVVLGSGNEYSDEDESSLETITSRRRLWIEAGLLGRNTVLTPF
jgi:hypothetical protein